MSDMPYEFLEKENKTQKIVHQELETQEKLSSHPHVTESADISAQTNQKQLQNDISTLRGTEFKTLEKELIPAESVFARQGANYYEQHDPVRKNQSRRKSARKQAAARQVQNDQTRKNELQCKLRDLSEDRKKKEKNGEKDPESLLVCSVLTEELTLLDQSPVRQDETGFVRRQNETKYARRRSVNQKMRETAQTDVNNLVNNLRRDIVLEGKTSFPEDLSVYTDAFYFSNWFGEATVYERTLELQKMVNKMNEEKEEKAQKKIDAYKTELNKTSKMALILKGYGSNFSVKMLQQYRTIRAHQYARQQIADEGNSIYNQLMLEILDDKIKEMLNGYNKTMEDLQSANGTNETPEGAALLDLQKELARLRKEMKENEGDERVKEEKRKKAKELITNFTWQDENIAGDKNR